MGTRDNEVTATAPKGTPRKQNWFAAGGVIGGVLASSCCLAPFLLLMLGVSGAWISNLTAVEPYKPVFIGIALMFIALGFRQVYFKPKRSCEEDSYCARPQSSTVTKTALWVATSLVVLAASVDRWAPLFY